MNNHNEPCMYIHRPSSARSQDTSHILSRIFRNLYQRDPVTADTVDFLVQSAEGDDEVHTQYVSELKKVTDERDKKISEINMLERHIQQAQAATVIADERQLEVRQNMPDLGLPPERSHFRRYLDSDLLRKYKLIIPEDYNPIDLPIVQPPSAGEPHYTRETVNYSRRSNRQSSQISEKKLLQKDDYLDDYGHLPSDDDSVPDTSAPPQSSKKKKKTPNDGQETEKVLWKKQMSADARQDARAQLANMQAKVNFLKNPRYIKDSGENLLFKGNQVFLPIPEVVVISDYVPGKVYEVDLELKNITKVLRNVRVIPPRTAYFSIGLGRFPAENGLIASGMSCQFTVRFAPDSLADFDDELIVQSNGSEFVVPLKGKRLPPELNIPDIIELGGSLVGGTKIGQVQVQNTGGMGRFAVVPRSAWPTTQFKVKSQGGAISVPPFEFRPSLFAVRPGQSAVLDISFSPKEVKEYEEEITIVCDNCQVKHIKLRGEGQLATVELSEVDGGEKAPAAGELADTLCDHFIDFGILYPYTYMEKSFTISNKTAVDLPFIWVIIKPDFREKPNEIRVRDTDTRFSIKPETGLLLANESMTFLLAFAPPIPKLYHSVLHFVLPQMPVPKTPSVEQSRASSLSSLNRGSVQTDFEDVAALQIDIRGTCEPFSVLFEPYALHVPGTIPVQTVVKKPLHVVNQSLTPIVFSFQRVTEPAIIHAEPAEGEIPPNSDCLVEVCISGSVPGKMEHNLMCLIQHHDEPLYLNVRAEFAGPEIGIDEASISYGLVREGNIEERWITVRNQSRVPANWSINLEEGDLGENELCLEPAKGTLAPLKCTTVKVELRALTVKSLNLLLSAKVQDGNTIALRCTAEVQAPKVCLTESIIQLGDVFMEAERKHAVVLYNQTVIPTYYKWGKVVGKGQSKVSAKVIPDEGEIAERESMACILSLICHSLDDVEDLRIPCTIEGQADPLWLSFSCKVKGLSVSFRDEDSSYDDENIKIQMDELTIGNTVTKKLLIRNDTSIIAPFSCTLKNFGAKPPTPPHKAAMPNKGQRRALQQRSSIVLDKPPKTLRAKIEAQRPILQNSKGLALILEPGIGVLDAYSETVVSVTACANLWGDYQDLIQCKVGDLPIQEIPVNIKVSGSPLILQLSAMTTDAKTPILRFGSHVAGSYVIRRQLKILNNGPCDIRIDFQAFDRHDEDEQLLDFVVAYKPAFPVKDEKGYELVPESDEETEELLRQMTDELPLASTDTSFVLSRATTLKAFREPRPKIIDVHLFKHDGQTPSKYFNIEPQQIVIPADGTNIAVVSYLPPPAKEVTAPLDILAHALGWLSLPEEEKNSPSAIRKDGYDVDTLAVEMTAAVVPARLSVEYEDEDNLHFRSAASDLLSKNTLLENYVHVRSMTLQNVSQTPIKLQLRTKPPFYIIGETDEAKSQTDRVTVKARQHLVIKVGFRLSMQLLDLLNGNSDYDKSIPSNLETATSTSPKKTDEDDRTETDEEEFITHIDEGISFVRRGDDRRLQFSSDVILKYDNGETEILPIDAFVLLPSLKVSRNNLEIGTCLVGEYRQKMFFLNNPSLSSSFWTVSIEKQSSNCAQDTFRVEPDSGMLHPGQTSLINVIATPHHSENYDIDLIVHGLLGEIDQRIHVTASGSYDTRHEVLLPA